MVHHASVATLADLVDPEKLLALRAAIGTDAPAETEVIESGGPLETKAAEPVVEESADVEVEFKGDDAPVEHKNDAGTSVIEADDETGLVTAIVSVTGIRDRVDDIIEPGAYAETLNEREPIGVWSHDDKTWVARCEDAAELLPGDPFFQTKEFLAARDGKPWPREAGALLVKARFNLETPHGAAAYSDVKFFKGKTGWSIGYRVKRAVRSMREGVRRIKSLSWFEFSPVMVGAAADSMTLSVKSLAQPVDAETIPDAPEFDLELWDAEQVAEYEQKRAAFLDALEEKGAGGLRRVRTPEGERRYSEPVGGIIKPDAPGGMEGPLHGLTKSVGKMHAPGGWEVEAINLDGKPKLRAKRHGTLVGHGYFNSPAELALAGVPVAQLKDWDGWDCEDGTGAIPVLELEEKRGGLKVAQKCKYCAADATHAHIWAEGMAYIPTCDEHDAKAKTVIEDDNNDELIRTVNLPERKALPADMVQLIEARELLDVSVEVLDLELKLGRHVRTPEGARVFGKPIGSLITPADEARVRGGEHAKLDTGGGVLRGGSGRHRGPAPDAGQGAGTTKPGEVQQKSPPAPPTAMRARTAAEQARTRAHEAQSPEERALASMEADVLERFARTVDTEDAAAYDKPGADPINFHGGQPSGLRRLLQKHLPKHLKKAEAEAAIGIIVVEGATMLALTMGLGGHEHYLQGVAIGSHMMVAAAVALKEAIKDFRENNRENRAVRRAAKQTKAFDPSTVHPEVETESRKMLKAVVAAARDEWQQLVDSGEPMDDDTYNGIINRIVAKVHSGATDMSNEGEGDMGATATSATETKDVSTSSVPPQTISGFGNGKTLEAIDGKADLGMCSAEGCKHHATVKKGDKAYCAEHAAEMKTADELYLELKAATMLIGELDEGEPAVVVEPAAVETKTRCAGCGSAALLSSGTCALCGLETKAAAVTAEEVAEIVGDPTAEETLFGSAATETIEEMPTVTDEDLDDPELIADVLNAEAELLEDGFEEPAVEEKAATMTHEPLGTPGGKQNWIDKTGQLPAYIQHIAKDLHEERGMTLSRAIATAISMVRKWAAGGKDVKPDTRAKAAAAVAEFEALRAKNKARQAAKDAGIDLTWFDHADTSEFKLYGHDSEYVIVDSLWKTELLNDQLEQKGLRRVKTPEGVREFHKPIGSPIEGGSPYAAMRHQMGRMDAETGQHHNTEHPDNLAAHRGSVLARLHSHGKDGKQPAGEPVHTHANSGPSMADPIMSDADLDRLVAASHAHGAHEDAAALEEVRKLPPNKRYARLQMYRHGQWHPSKKSALDAELEQLETKAAPTEDTIVRLDESELLAARRLALAID